MDGDIERASGNVNLLCDVVTTRGEGKRLIHDLPLWDGSESSVSPHFSYAFKVDEYKCRPAGKA